ncbi:MAG TPA: GNAT family N-acetyltransferase [Beutenbergiaceae bacterium]|nr:GNAT family N-acetyltransferase [Beutenbergiaceae bacterium]
MVEPAELILRPPEPQDESQVRAASEELAAENFPFIWEVERDWSDVLRQIDDERRGVHLPPGRVRATYLLALLGETVVGRTSIRHELTEGLVNFGGHIGYAVRPAYRGRGLATAILTRSLDLLRQDGLNRALLVCEDGNEASARVITKCGGVLEDVRSAGPATVPMRRYWIDLTRG